MFPYARCTDPYCCPTRKRDTYTVSIQECANGTFTVTLTHSGNEYAASVTGVLDYATAAALGSQLVQVIC